MKKKIKNFFTFNNNFLPLTPKLDFIRICNDKMSIIDDNYNFLLKRTKQQILVDKKMEEMQKKQSIDREQIEFEKKLKIEKKRRMLIKKHQFIISAYNNKMVLDMILKNKKFIKYITEQQKNNTKTESNLDIKNEPSHKINTISNVNENNIDENDNKELNLLNIPVQKEEKKFKLQNNYIKTDYTSTQNSDMNNFNINNESNSKYSNKKKFNISFPINSSFFTTALPIVNNNDTRTPKKSVLSLKKNKLIENSTPNNNKKPFINIYNDLDNDVIINNKNINIQKYKANSINKFMNNNNENKMKRNILKFKNINKVTLEKDMINSNKKCKLKESFFSESIKDNCKFKDIKRRPLTSTYFKYKK